MEEINLSLGEMFKEIIGNQIKDNKPPISKKTYDRLISEGNSKEESIRLMACVMTAEFFNMSKDKRVFDEKEYEKMMINLPKMPWN
jgi:peroxiredoxin family protein